MWNKKWHCSKLFLEQEFFIALRVTLYCTVHDTFSQSTSFEYTVLYICTDQ